MLPGAFVQVEIVGRTIPNTFVVPRTAVSEGNKVWLVDEKSLLARREIRIGWENETSYYVTQGLEPGARLVTTPLALPVEGMPVRTSPSTAQDNG